MKVIIPIAGWGKRMRPHTHTKPKPLLPIAGKPIIDHIMDIVLPLHPTEVIFITGHLKQKIEEHIREKYKHIKTKFIEQKELLGTASAIGLAYEAFDEDILVIFGDTIFDADLSVIKASKDDGITWAMPKEDYQRFGIILTDENSYMIKIVEKPKHFIGSNLANTGIHYFKNTKLLKEGIEYTLKNRPEGKEAYLTDSIQFMIERGAKIKILPCEGWYDTGQYDTTLESNKILLDKLKPKHKQYPGTVIIDPCAIDDSAEIENSIIGPHVSIGPDVSVKNSKVESSILDEGAEVHEATLSDSIIGVEASVKGRVVKAIIGDHSRIH